MKFEAESKGMQGYSGRTGQGMILYVMLWFLDFNLKGKSYELECLEESGR